MDMSMLAPAAVLVLWTMAVLLWTTATRFPAISRASKEDLRTLPRVGVRGQDLERILPASVSWKAHNYSHLMEQPTVFYPTVVILHLAGAATTTNLTLAWAYVALRIVHSLWQGLVNKIPVRIALFGVSSLCLIVLAVNAVRATLGA